MLVHLMHFGTARACGSPHCASDGLCRPSHRVRYALRQVRTIEKLLDGGATLIAAPACLGDTQRMIFGTYASHWIVRDVVRRIREM